MAKIETVEDLEKIIGDQNAVITGLGELARAMDQRIKLLTALVDHHHDIFIAHGWATPRPKADPLAN
jgi:hypothetical protein